MDRQAWDDRYAAASSVWSGRPNAALVRHLGEVAAAGAALDVGCGEGADAIWLAARGWQVVAVDWAGSALDRARAHARAAGVPADRLAFAECDATDAATLQALGPGEGFALVTVAFMHPEPGDRARAYRHLASLLAPGGRLLVVAHDPSHGAAGLGGPPQHRLLGPADIVGALHLAQDMEVAHAAVEEREGADSPAAALDAVVLVRRRP